MREHRLFGDDFGGGTGAVYGIAEVSFGYGGGVGSGNRGDGDVIGHSSGLDGRGDYFIGIGVWCSENYLGLTSA